MTPSSRLASVIELKQYGVNVHDSVFLRLLNLPDLKEETKRITAPVEYTEWVIGKMIKGEAVPLNTPLIAAHGQEVFDRVLNASLDAEMRGAPEEVLAAFHQYLGDVMDLIQRSMEPPPPPVDPMAMAGAPPVDPMMADPAMAGLPPGPPMDPGIPPAGVPPILPA
jgi:hypothetical protein